MKPKVAVLKTDPGTVLDDVSTLMQMADFSGHLDSDKPTNINVNLSWHLWFPACSTTPWQLEGVLKALAEEGFSDDSLRLVECRDDLADDRRGDLNNGIRSVADRYGLGLIRPQEQEGWVRFQPEGELLVIDRLSGEEGLFVPEIFPGSNTIQLPTLKMHGQTGISGAVRNIAGSMLRDDSSMSGTVVHEAMVDLLTLQKESSAGMFAVMDGTFSGEGAGPRTMMPFEKDYMIASGDLVALDAVAAKMMGFDPLEIEYIRLAHDRGLGCGDVEGIEIVGEDIGDVDFHFSRGTGCSTGRVRMSDCRQSRLVQDYCWYPYVGWPRASRMAETKWGQMLQDYLPEEAEPETQGRGKLPLAAAAAAVALMGMSAIKRISALAQRP